MLGHYKGNHWAVTAGVEDSDANRAHRITRHSGTVEEGGSWPLFAVCLYFVRSQPRMDMASLIGMSSPAQEYCSGQQFLLAV